MVVDHLVESLVASIVSFTLPLKLVSFTSY